MRVSGADRALHWYAMASRSERRVLPELPPGYTTFPVWGFREPTRPISFEFHRVYDPRGRLDQNLSYWVMSWPVFTSTGDEQPASRWIRYGDARRRLGRRLGFRDFSSPYQMGPRLGPLLVEAEVEIPERPRVGA